MDSLRTRHIKRAVAPFLLIVPTVLLVGVFVFGVINGVLQGFGIMPFLGKTEFTLDYYALALARSDFLSATGYSLYLAAVSSFGALLGGIVLSAALTHLRANRGLYLFGVQVPLMTAHVLVVLFIVSLFSGSGLFARLLFAAGAIDGLGAFPSVVGDVSGWGIILTYLWKEIPFIAFCTIAIMSNVSGRYGEASLTLGASPLRSFFEITLPLCRPALTKAFLVVFAFAFGSYEVPYLLGPTLPKALPILAYLEFQNPDILNRSYAMAINGTMAFICCLLAVAYFLVLQREKRR